MICQINGALTFFVYYFNCFFLRLIITCRLWVIYVREDNHSNVKVMIKRLIWTIWTLMSSVLKKADKLNLSLSLCMIMASMNSVQCSAFTNDMLIVPEEPLPMLMSHLDPPEASVYHAANVRILQFLLVVFALLCDVRIGKSMMKKCSSDISHF